MLLSGFILVRSELHPIHLGEDSAARRLELTNLCEGGSERRGNIDTLVFSEGLARGDGSNNRHDWFATVRGRLGYAIDRLLIYGTGGVAFRDTNNDNGFLGGFASGAAVPANFYVGTAARINGQSVTPTNTFGFFSDRNNNDVGYAVGGGLEYAFTNNLTAKLEGLYVNFDRDRRNMQSILADPLAEAQRALSDPHGPRMHAIATHDPATGDLAVFVVNRSQTDVVSFEIALPAGTRSGTCSRRSTHRKCRTWRMCGRTCARISTRRTSSARR